MHWKTFVALAVSVLPTANAGIRYGCWSDAGVKFHHDCVVAITALIQERAIIDHGDYFSVPKGSAVHYWGNCRAEVHSDRGISVAAKNLLDSFDQIASRCQRGWFSWDNLLDGNIQGHAGWKRDKQGNIRALASDSDFTKESSILVWEDLTTMPEAFPLPEESDSLKESIKAGDNIKRQHDRDLITRATPFGILITTKFITGSQSWRLYRGTGFTQTGQQPVSYQITLALFQLIHAFIEGAKGLSGHNVIRDGLSQPTGSTVEAIAIASQLNIDLFSNWQSLFQANPAPGGDAGSAIGEMMWDAVHDMATGGFVGAVYHIYNENSEVILSWILNGIAGTVTPLPS